MKSTLAATAALVLAASAYGQGTMYLLDSNRNIYTVDLATAAKTQVGTVSAGGTVGGLAYDCQAGIMYMTSTSEDMLYTLNLTTFVATPVGSYGDSGITMHGLEWDPDTGQLFGGSDGSLYTIDPLTGTATEIGNAGVTSFLNLGYHSGRGILYGAASTNDSLYIIDRNTGAGTLVGPLNGPTNPHGLAYVPSNDTMYLACSSTDTLSTINVDTGAATVVGFLGAGNWLGLAWVPESCPTPPAIDARLSLSAPARCSVGAGGAGTWLATVVNAGTSPVTNATVTFTLPAGSTFVSSVPATTPSGGAVTTNLGALAPGATATFSVTVQLPSQGFTTGSAGVTISETDERPLNNTASRGTLVAAAVPTSAAARGLVSNVSGQANGDVPGLPGVRFSTTVFERPFRSPNGQFWIMEADTDFATTTADAVLLVGNATDEIVVGAREGDIGPDGTGFGTFDTVAGINNSGHFAFSTNTTATVADEVVVKWDGTAFSYTAQEGNLIPNTAFGYGASSGSSTIQADGTTSFQTSMTGATTATDTAIFMNNGATLVAQEGTTIPTGQIGGTSYTVKALDTGATDGQGFFPSADGQHYLWSGTINDPVLAQDRVVVVDNAVVLQEGAPVPNSNLAPITVFNYSMMESGGDWLAYGENGDTIGWVVRNGALLASTHTPIFTGASENWSNAVLTDTFFFVAGSPNGSYAIGGATDSTSTLTDNVIVLNSTTVIARENDPIDLNNNGQFDDNVYIRGFSADSGFLTDTDLYIVVQVRDGGTAVGCDTTNSDLGDALVRIPLPATCPGNQCGPADYNGDGDVGTDQDIEAFFACLGGNCCAACFCQGADFNGDGDVGTDQDIEAYFRVLGGGSC